MPTPARLLAALLPALATAFLVPTSPARRHRSVARHSINPLRRFTPAAEPGKLILLRHGESLWNFNNTFTGWADADLSEDGRLQAERAARLMLESGVTFDIVFASLLKRSIRTAYIVMRGTGLSYRNVQKDWRLNERMYGALTGRSKASIALEFGEEQCQAWRRGLHDTPPALTLDHEHWPGRDRRYRRLFKDSSDIPLTESLQDCMDRSIPCLEDEILPQIRSGRDVLVCAHLNTIRGLVKHLEGLGDGQIMEVEIPNGIPLVYKFDTAGRVTGNVLPTGLSGSYLASEEQTKAAIRAAKQFSEAVPGYDAPPTFLSPMSRALSMLKAEREVMAAASAPADGAGADADKEPPALQVFDKYDDYSSSLVSEGPVICIIRHGKTENNQLGLFTGWEDVPLAEQGRLEASAAGQLLREYDVKFDYVYTSWLTRAIETAWLVIDELDGLWLPITKSWRLNERMYGALTGMSKKMIQRTYGDEQFTKWRRGYTERPPRVDSFSPFFPGNDERYVGADGIVDLRPSVRESLIRTIGTGRPTVVRKLPKTESLRDCMERTIPYLLEEILPNAVRDRQNVLVASSENAIRGMLMHLCDIPEDRIHEVEIPTGLPMIYDIRGRCIRLLDDGKGPWRERYNFGEAAELLFQRSCDVYYDEDGDLAKPVGSVRRSDL